jgi:hypothetical protein
MPSRMKQKNNTSWITLQPKRKRNLNDKQHREGRKKGIATKRERE